MTTAMPTETETQLTPLQRAVADRDRDQCCVALAWACRMSDRDSLPKSLNLYEAVQRAYETFLFKILGDEWEWLDNAVGGIRDDRAYFRRLKVRRDDLLRGNPETLKRRMTPRYVLEGESDSEDGGTPYRQVDYSTPATDYLRTSTRLARSPFAGAILEHLLGLEDLIDEIRRCDCPNERATLDAQLKQAKSNSHIAELVGCHANTVSLVKQQIRKEIRAGVYERSQRV